MSDDSVNLSALRVFTPLDGLKRANLTALAKKTDIRKLASGQALFKLGDTEKRTFYLMSGRIQLTDKDGNTKVIEGGTEDAKSPLAPMLPRRYTAKALNEVQFISIDTDLLDQTKDSLLGIAVVRAGDPQRVRHIADSLG